MGFFGGDDSNQETNDLMNQQIEQNQAELESKRQNLYNEKLDIIKGQGGESWTPDRTSGAGGMAAKPSISKGYRGGELVKRLSRGAPTR